MNGTDKLTLFLQIMQTANMLTPTILSVAQSVRDGRAAGRTDDEIQAESARVLKEVIDEADRQLNVRPTE